MAAFMRHEIADDAWGAVCFKAVPAVQGSERRQRLAGP